MHHGNVFSVLILYFSIVNICANAYGELSPSDKFSPPLPFPPCNITDVQCQRRGLRTFFFLMETGYLGMRPIDPLIVESIAVVYPNQQMSVRLRRAYVNGGKWSKLVDRKFNLLDGKNGVRFTNDLYVIGEIVINIIERYDPIVATIAMNIVDVDTNITYKWSQQTGMDREEYLVIGQERIAVRTSPRSSYYLQPDTANINNTENANLIDQILQANPIIFEHISREIAETLMDAVINNFRIFASKIPLKYYYVRN